MTPFLLLAAIALAMPLHAASFDCAKAASKVEKAICASATLSALDEELARDYARARALVSDRAALTRAQRTWIATERDAGEDAGAIEAAYLARIEELRMTPELAKELFARQKPPASIFGRYSHTEPLCLIEDGETKCESDAESWIEISAADGNAVHVKSELVFFNGHICTVDGRGEWVDGVLRIPQMEDARCVLLLRFEDEKVMTGDPAGYCKWALCGMRGGFHNIELPKKNAP